MALNKQLTTVLFFVVGAISLPAVAADQMVKAEDAIRYRQSVYNVIGWHWKPLAAMIKGNKPFKVDEFVYNAEIIAYLNKLPLLAAFTPGTERGANTKARPEIWKDWGDFKLKMDKMQIDLNNLVVASKSGDLSQMKDRFVDAAKSCKACHDDYRNK